MKKTLTVNLNNIVFHIDDDAYEILQVYLADVSKYLSEDERKEVMNDIEARIAELFTERLQKNKNVVNIQDVEEVIKILGNPSEYGEEGTDEEKEDAPKSEKKRSHRFYRDPENAILGGVSAGIAAYFGWDVTWIRIALVVLALVSGGNFIPIYLLVWIIAPKAVTAAQRLEMQGSDVTVENIKSEINNVKNYMDSDKFKQKANNVSSRFVEVFGSVMKVVLGVLGAIFGFLGIVLAGAIIIALLLLIFDPSVFYGFAPDIISNWTLLGPDKSAMIIISLVLVIGCPVFMLVYWGSRAISGKKEKSRSLSLAVILLWLAGIFMFYNVGTHTIIHWDRLNSHTLVFNWDQKSSPSITEQRTFTTFHGLDVSGNIHVDLRQDTIQKVEITAPQLIMSKVHTDVENGILEIYTDNFFFNQPIKVKISEPEINTIKVSGASKVVSKSKINSEDLRLELSGASSAKLDVNLTDKFDAEVSGASYAEVNGQASRVYIEASGASKIEADQLTSKDAVAKASGASHIRVYSTESVNADASGASEIECKGHPASVDKSENFGSRVIMK